MRRDDLCQAVRERLHRLPPPYASHYGVVPAPPPEYTILLEAAAKKAHTRANSDLARISALAADLHDPFVVSRLLTRREAVSSSAMEGTNSTLDELLSVEESADADADRKDAAHQVRDYATALETLIPLAQELGPEIFTTGLVSELHCLAMKSDPNYQDLPGQLRDSVVWIGGIKDIAYSTFNPPPPAYVPECLEQSLAYMRGEGMQEMHQSLITRMAISHAHFEAVHPVRDGNGRVGRLLLPLMMAAEGNTPLYLSPYIAANKDRYYSSLKAAQQRLDWAAVVAFLSEAISGTVDELMVTREALQSLVERWAYRRKFRAGSTALKALEILPSYPVITATHLAKILKVSFRGAMNAIEVLMEAGILVEGTGRKRNRIFRAPEVLSLINRPFGAEPILLE